MRDVIVVGAGPIGNYIASNLAGMGYDVLVVEEHSDIGNPSHCSGLFSTHVFEIVGKIGILHPSRRARIISPSGKVLVIGNREIRAYVVDRVEFDRSLARRAINNGAEFLLKTRVRKSFKGGVLTTRGEFRSRLVVGADGISSVVRRYIGVNLPGAIGAAQSIARYDYDEEDSVTIYVGSKVAPGFFAWIIPLYDGFVKVGLASYGHSWDYLKRLLKRLNAKPLSISGGGIPMGFVSRSYAEGAIIVGDAAGQVKATSGGGVYPGLRAAQCAIEILNESLQSGDYSAEKLREYDLCWRSSIGRELSNTLRIHGFYRKIKDDEFDSIVEELRREDMLRIINEYGDIDYPSRVVWKLLKRNPTVLKYVRIAMR